MELSAETNQTREVALLTKSEAINNEAFLYLHVVPHLFTLLSHWINSEMKLTPLQSDPLPIMFHLGHFNPIDQYSTACPGCGHGGSSLSSEAQTFSSLATSSNFLKGIPRSSRANRDTQSVSPGCPGSSRGPPTGGTCLEHLTRHPGDIPTRCPSHLIWLFST